MKSGIIRSDDILVEGQPHISDVKSVAFDVAAFRKLRVTPGRGARSSLDGAAR